MSLTKAVEPDITSVLACRTCACPHRPSQVLATLGQSRLSSNLNQLAHLANVGALPVTPELEAELAEALADIRAIRLLLLTALGFKEQAAP